MPTHELLMTLRAICSGGIAMYPRLAPVARQAVSDGLATHCPIRCAFALTGDGWAIVRANTNVEIPFGAV